MIYIARFRYFGLFNSTVLLYRIATRQAKVLIVFTDYKPQIWIFTRTLVVLIGFMRVIVILMNLILRKRLNTCLCI
jgi:hypothetical protein